MESTTDQRVAVVIEDDDDIRHLLETVLSQAGFRVVATANGQDGVEAVRNHDPVVTTLDVNMPGMDGFEVARRIRSFSATYIVMLTALNEEIDTLQGLEAGADDYINKPFRPRELRARIEAMLRRPRLPGHVPGVPKVEEPAPPTAPQYAPPPQATPEYRPQQPPQYAPPTQPSYQQPVQPVPQQQPQYQQPAPPAPSYDAPPQQPQYQPPAPPQQPQYQQPAPPVPPVYQQPDPYVTPPTPSYEAPAQPTAPAPVAPAPGSGEGWMEHNGLWLNMESRVVRLGQDELDLTRSEFDLLAALMETNRRVRTKADLVLLLRGESYVTTHFISEADKRAIEVHMGNLRKKLGDTSGAPRWIETVRGVGYRLTAPEE